MYSSSQQQRQQQPATQNFYSLLCIHLSHIHFLCAVCSICFRFYSRLRPILSLVCSRFHFPVGAGASMHPACNLYATFPFHSLFLSSSFSLRILFHSQFLFFLHYGWKLFIWRRIKVWKANAKNRWYRRRWWLRSNSSCVAFYSMHSIWQWRWQSGNYFIWKGYNVQSASPMVRKWALRTR